MAKFVKPAVGVFTALSLVFAPAIASAASVPAPVSQASISPFVALSAYGTAQSRAAVCAAGVSSAAAMATSSQAPGQGCVLPVLDAPVVPGAPAAGPVAYAPAGVGGFGYGIGPILAGLIAITGLAAVILAGKDNGKFEFFPISPS